MPAEYGMKSSFVATDGNLRLNIEDLVEKYPSYKFPALKRLNSNIFKKPVLSHKYEWSSRDNRAIKALLVDATVSDSATSFIVDTAGVFNKDDIVQNVRTGEKMYVQAVTGGVNVTVVRGFGADAAAMVANDILVRVGVAAPAGAKVDSMVISGLDDLYNFTQIYEDVVEMDDGQYKGFIRGDESQAELIERKQQELMEGLHLDLFLGSRYIDKVRKISTMGGFKYMVDTYAANNAIDFGGSATWSSDVSAINKFEDAVEKIALKMGGKPTIYATYKALRKLRLVQDDTVRTDRDDKKRGIGVVNTLQSGMGDLDIVQIIDRSGVMDNYMFFIDETGVGYKARKGRGWFTEEKPYSGDGHIWQVVGEYTTKVSNPEATVAYVHNLGL